jgi:hypothetical protein
MNLSSTQFNEEEHIDSLKPDSFHSEEVASQDLFFVVAHQVTPTNGSIANGCWLDSMTVENISHG